MLDIPPIPEHLRLPVQSLARAAELFRCAFIALFEGRPMSEVLDERMETLLTGEETIDHWLRHLGIEDGCGSWSPVEKRPGTLARRFGDGDDATTF